jgi:uncharacterized protein YkwD
MKSIFFTLSLFLLVACGNSSGGSNDTTQREELNYLNQESLQLLSLVNTYRELKGLKKLIIHQEASLQAQEHTSYMAQTYRGLTHNGFSLRVDTIEHRSNIPISRSAENVAYNTSTTAAHSALLSSYGHRKNIEGDYTHIGLGQETDSNGRMYYTQIFVKVE